MRGMSEEEKQILVRSQSILHRKREISQFLSMASWARNLPRPCLSISIVSDEYLEAIENLPITRAARLPATFGLEAQNDPGAIAWGSLKASFPWLKEVVP